MCVCPKSNETEVCVVLDKEVFARNDCVAQLDRVVVSESVAILDEQQLAQLL